ncbi:MAG: hypothetical protein HKN03_03330 [Acidimicrobiales bacterium]|nr:hypothetical protein [Acidimicrobiales bacterium]
MTSSPDPSSVDLSDLRAADPVRMADLPRASDPDAVALLQRVSAISSPTPAQARRGLRNRFVPLGAVAAAFLVVVVGFTVFSPSNTETALATVKTAAQEVAAADSGRATTGFEVDGVSNGVSDRAAGTAVLTFNGNNFAVTLDLDDLPQELKDQSDGMGDLLSEVETRFVDGVIYGRGGPVDDWIAVELPSVFIDQIRETADPRSVLETVQTLVETEEVGATTIEGVEVTHYQSIVDLDEKSLAESGWLAGVDSQIDVDTDGTLTVDLFVTGAGQLIKIDVFGTLAATEATDSMTATFSISTLFTDLNAVAPITAPEGVVPTPFLAGELFEEPGS